LVGGVVVVCAVVLVVRAESKASRATVAEGAPR
jgi:hypothetical protein